MTRRQTGHTWIIAALSVATVPSACDRRPENVPAGTSGVVVRDSAGVEIVESREPVWSRAPRTLDVEPVLAVGVVDGEAPYQFAQLVGATLLADGAIAVIEGSVSEIRVFEPGGAHRVTFGGRGEGPGAFGGVPILASFPGDTILVLDHGNRRVSWFATDGNFLGARPVPEAFAPASSALRPGTGWAILRDGSLFAQAFVRGGTDGPGLVTIGYHPLLFPPEEALPVDLGEYVRGEAVMIPLGDGLFDAAPNPFAPANVAVAGPGRFPVVISDANAWELRWHGADGSLRRVARAGVGRTPITDEMLAFERDALVSGRGSTGTRGSALQGAFDQLPFADSLPAIASLHVATDGTVWAGHRRPERGLVTRFSLFDPEGAWLGDVDIPEALHGMALLGVGTDYVLARVRDELDVQYLHMYRVSEDRR